MYCSSFSAENMLTAKLLTLSNIPSCPKNDEPHTIWQTFWVTLDQGCRIFLDTILQNGDILMNYQNIYQTAMK
jgi:hypothetical protein